MAHEKVYGICENKCRVKVPTFEAYNDLIVNRIGKTFYLAPSAQTIDVGTIAAGGSQYVNITPTRIQDYRPIGVAGYSVSGASGKPVICYGIMCINRISDLYATELYNSGSSSASVTLNVQFIYVRDDMTDEG